MNSMSSTVAATPIRRPRLSVKNRIGLILAVVSGVIAIASTFLVPEPAPGETGPPLVVLVAGAILGAVGIVAAVYTWVTHHRVGARIASGSLILSALTAVPAFFEEGVPAPLVIWAAAGILLTAVNVYLLLSRPASDE